MRGALMILVAGILLAMLLSAIAYGAPPPGSDPDSETAQWYRGLKQPGSGMSCCDVSDCRHEPSRTGPKGYEVFIDNRWLAVPPDKILNQYDNPTGESVTCHAGPAIFCFIVGVET